MIMDTTLHVLGTNNSTKRYELLYYFSHSDCTGCHNGIIHILQYTTVTPNLAITIL
jgi:hypothetical protein